LGKETGNEGYLLMTGLWEKEGKWSGSSCWKNEWGFVLFAGQIEENGGTAWRGKPKTWGPVLLARKKWGRAGGLEKIR